jgi:thioesterase domain-containing protein
MARQLQELNEQVQTLAIIDSGVLHACAVVTSMFPRGQPGVYDLMRRPFAETVEGFRQISSSARLIPEAADDEQAARIYSLFTSHVDAVLKYRPKRYTGEIQLFQAKDQLVRERFEPYREWCQICDQVQLHLVPGDHLNMVQAPHVDTLAEKLGRCLAA